MRDILECQAEVFRRSEKRINARKRRRNHMLMVCIPVVMCAAMLLPFFVPEKQAENPNGLGSPESVMDGVSEIVIEEYSRQGLSITVSGSGLSWVVEDDSAAMIISGYLLSFGTRGHESNGLTDDKVVEENAEDSVGGSGSIEDSANEGYAITLVMGEGEKIEYYLAGNTLENVTSKQTCFLSEKQVKELQSLLGITHP